MRHEKIKERMTNCEFCHFTKQDLEEHHIVYRSEQPHHKELNNPLNLITICRRCHEKLHGKKYLRNELIEQRGLNKLFNCNLKRNAKNIN